MSFTSQGLTNVFGTFSNPTPINHPTPFSIPNPYIDFTSHYQGMFNDIKSTKSTTNNIIGFTASCFDLMHAGHCIMLEEAKKNCNFMICAIQTDPSIDRPEKNKPIQTFEERCTILKSNRYVDYVIPYNTEAELLYILTNINPDIRFLGTDYVGKPFTGNNLNIPIYYCSREHGYSTTSLRDRIYQAELFKKYGKYGFNLSQK